MSEEKNGIVKKVISGVITIFCLLGGYYALNKFFTPREIFDISCDASEKRFKAVDKRFTNAQKQDQIIQLQNQQLYYETRILNLQQSMRYEKDPMERVKMNGDIQSLRRSKEIIEDNLIKLKGGQ